MVIHEPMTLLTDYLLAGWILLLAHRLRRAHRETLARATRLWYQSFLIAAAAALTGGAVHGFSGVLGRLTSLLLWKFTVFAVGTAGFLLVAGALYAVVRPPARQWLLLMFTVKLLAYLAWMVVHNDFRYVIYDYAPDLVAVLLLMVYAFLRRRGFGPLWVAAGILVSFAAAAVQALGFAPHPQFNHNDLYHVVQMGAFYLLYRGGRLLEDEG